MENVPMARPQVVLLVSIDSLRADHLSCYGYVRSTSPNLDRLARESVRFETCYPQGAYTFPAHISMLTSIHSATHRLRNGDVLKYNVKTVADYLHDSGYATAGFVSNGMLAGDLGLREHFDLYDDGMAAPDDHSDTFSRSADVTSAACIEWFEQHATEPAFIFLHFNDCHGPYQTPPEYSQLFLNDGIHGTDRNVPIRHGIKDSIPPEYALGDNTSVQYYIAQYDSAIRYVDHHIKLVLDSIASHVALEDALIVITGDHGEAMGEHDVFFQHGKDFYEEFLRVPLLVKAPGAQATQLICAPVRHIDIVPTILDLAGAVDTPDYVQGISLLPLIQGINTRSSGRELFDIKLVTAYIRHRNWKYLCSNDYSLLPPDQGLTDVKRHLKQRLRPRQEKLFRLDTDPEETANLIEAEPALALRLRSRLLALLALHDPAELAEYVRADAPMVGDEIINERLRSLGYIE
jgi:arylsulfatase A-like enzyme